MFKKCPSFKENFTHSVSDLLSKVVIFLSDDRNPSSILSFLKSSAHSLYWEAADLEAMLAETSDPFRCLQQYPDIFRKSLESDNRMCLCSFMAAEYDDLPEAVKKEVQTFADVNVAWLSKVLSAAAVVDSGESERRARAIFAAVAGAQLMARSRSDISLFDSLIESYRVAGLLPA